MLQAEGLPFKIVLGLLCVEVKYPLVRIHVDPKSDQGCEVEDSNRYLFPLWSSLHKTNETIQWYNPPSQAIALKYYLASNNSYNTTMHYSLHLLVQRHVPWSTLASWSVFRDIIPLFSDGN